MTPAAVPHRSPSGAARRVGSAAGVLLALLVLLLVAAPQVARAALFGAETFTLANGLEVVVVPNHRAPVVMHMVWYKAGAADEPAGKSGIAHFLEHLMFKGTEKYPGDSFSRIVAVNGGEENAFTSYDYTAYFQKIARDRLELVMDLESDRMTHLVLADDVVDPERDVVLEERRSRSDNDPAALFSEQLSAVQYLSHPYGRPIIGWEGEIHRLATDDALDFYRRHYAPNNAVLLVVGDITADELKPLAEKYYGGIPPADVPPRLRPETPPQVAARRLEYRDPQVGHPQWSRSYLAPSARTGGAEVSNALLVLAEILGGPTGRLNRSLVIDQKIAASANAYYDDYSFDDSEFFLSATPAAGVALDALEAAVDREVARLLKDGVSDEEVARAQDRMIANATYAADSLYEIGRIFGTALTAGLAVADVEDWPEAVAKATAEQVTAAARKVLRPEASVTGVLRPDHAS